MAVRTFQARLLWLIVAVLALLEAGTLVSVHFAGENTLRRSVHEELNVGKRIFDRNLRDRAARLADNQRKRVDAGAVALVDLDGNVTADTLEGRLTGRRFPFPSMLADAQKNGEASATITFANKPYQFVIVPVLAPRPIAWLCAGFEIDEKALAEVRRLTTLDVSLWSNAAGSISTLPPDQKNALAPLMSRNGGTEPRARLGDPDYALLLEPLQTSDNPPINDLLLRNLARAGQPFVMLERSIFALSFVMLLAAVVAAV